MINLLPEAQKKKIEKERMARVFAVALLMLFGVSLVMLAFLAPTVLINMAREKIALQKVEALKKSEPFLIEQDINNKIKEINTQLSFFSSDPFGVVISKDAVLSAINEKKNGISLITLTYTAKDIKSGSLSVQGLAMNREVLLNFVDALKKVKGFSSVNLPVSDFVKGRDLPFTVTLNVSNI